MVGKISRMLATKTSSANLPDPLPPRFRSEPTEQPSAANDATMFGRDNDEVYDSAAATGNGSQSPEGSEPQIATNQSAAPGEEQLSGRNDERLPEASQGAGNDQAAIEQEGAGEAAQSAPSPDSVTVLDEEKSRLGEQPVEQASGSERSSGRL